MFLKENRVYRFRETLLLSNSQVIIFLFKFSATFSVFFVSSI